MSDFGAEADTKVAKVIEEMTQRFGDTFGLRAFFGKVFRIGRHQSYLSDGVVLLYTQRKLSLEEYKKLYGSAHKEENDLWVDFAKSTQSELINQIIKL